MGEAFLDYKKGGSGLNINGIIEDYYVYAGEKVSAGDFVEFIKGVAGQTTGTSVDTALEEANANTGKNISALALDDNRVFITYQVDTKQCLYGMVCTIDGTTITAGTGTQLSTYTSSGNVSSLVLLPDGRVFIAYSYYVSALICSVVGTTITVVASSLKIGGSSKIVNPFSAILIEDNKVFITHSYDTSNYYLAGTVVTISGTTMTSGTITQLSTSVQTGKALSVELFDEGKVFIAHSYGSNYLLNAMVCTISGTTITAGTDTSLNGTSATGYTISTELLSDGKVFVAHGYQAYYLYGVVCTVNGTTIKKGENTMLIDATHMAEKLSTVVLPNGKVFIAHNYNDGSNYFLHGIVCTISGTTITAGTDTRLNDTNYTAYTISSILLDRGTIFIAHSYSSYYHLYAQVFGIDEENNIPTNNVVITEYETQVCPATSLPCSGVAKSSGEGGDETAHNEQVSIYVPELGVKQWE